MKSLIITHRDHDGITSAIGFAINSLEENKIFPSFENIISNFDIIDINRGETLEYHLKRINSSLENYKQIILLDYSLEIEKMQEIYNQFKKNFIWIDHHKQTNLEIENQLTEIKGLREFNNAACILVYKYFNKKPSLFSKYIEDMDLWKWEFNDSKYFILGIIELRNFFTEKMLRFVYNMMDDFYFNENKQKYIEKGKVKQEVIENQAEFSLMNSNFIDFFGYRAIITNTTVKAGEVFDIVKKKRISCDVLVTWYRLKKGIYKISVRSDPPIDISKIVIKEFNGGGHPQASGFIINDIEELYKRKIE